MARSFYSLVQYCPDRFRGETVNVGLILACENPLAMKVRMAREFSRLRAFFALSELDIDNLRCMLEGLESRIVSCVEGFQTMEDLGAFALTLANDLRLTEPEDAWVFLITRLMQLGLEYNALLVFDICSWIQHYSEVFVQDIQTLMLLDIFRVVVFMGWIRFVEIGIPYTNLRCVHNYRSKIP